MCTSRKLQLFVSLSDVTALGLAPLWTGHFKYRGRLCAFTGPRKPRLRRGGGPCRGSLPGSGSLRGGAGAGAGPPPRARALRAAPAAAGPPLPRPAPPPSPASGHGTAQCGTPGRGGEGTGREVRGGQVAALAQEQERCRSPRWPGRRAGQWPRLPPNKGAGPGPGAPRPGQTMRPRGGARPRPARDANGRSQWRRAARLFKKRSAGRGPLSAVRIPPRM